jgi:two-component system nitrate/nitrite response regulator NarL
VLVAARSTVYRLGFARLVEEHHLLRLAGVAADRDEAVRLIVERQPDVAVIELGLGGLPADEVASELRRRGLTTPILCMSEECSGELAMRLVGSGVTGYITTSATAEEVADAIIRVARGLAVLGADVSDALVPEIRRRADAGTRLTERELETLNHLAAGGTAKEIADRMHLAVPTVKNHTAHLYAKLGVKDRGAAVAEAMRNGWVV